MRVTKCKNILNKNCFELLSIIAYTEIIIKAFRKLMLREWMEGIR